MAIKTQVSAILNKKMDRQGFIKHVAVGVVAMTGAGAALRFMNPKPTTTTSQSVGYGGSAYGGVKPTGKTS